MFRRLKTAFLLSALLLATCTGDGTVAFRSTAAVFSVTPSSSTVARGGSVTLTTTNGTPPYQFRVTGNTGVGSVDLNTGVFTGQLAGTTQVTVTDWLGRTATVALTVPTFSLDTSFGNNGYSFLLKAERPDFLSVSGDVVTIVGGVAGNFEGFQVALSSPLVWNPLFTFDLAANLDFIAGLVDSVGNILSLGQASNTFLTWVASRRTSAGAVDSSYGTTPSAGSGYTEFPVVSGENFILPVAANQPNGKTVVAGYKVIGSDFFLQVARLDAAGAFDNLFTTSSFLLGPLLGDSRPGISMGPDGSFAVVVPNRSVVPQTMQLYRFSESGGAPSGSSPTTLGFGSTITPKDLVRTKSGELLGFGDSCELNKKLCGGRFNPDGAIDTNFGTAGRWSNDLGLATVDKQVFDADLLLDDRFVAVGQVYGSSNDETDDALIVTLTADGSTANHLQLDILPANFLADSARSVFVLPDGRFLVAGTDGTRWFLARFWP